MFRRYLLGPFDLQCYLTPAPLFDCCLNNLSIGECGVLKAPNNTVWEAIRDFSCSSVLFVFVFGALMFIVVILSRWICFRLACNALSLLISFHLKFLLSVTKIATSASSLVPFAWNTPFHPSALRWWLSLTVRCVLWMKQKIVSYFLTQPVSLCLCIGEMGQLKLWVTKCLLIAIALLLCIPIYLLWLTLLRSIISCDFLSLCNLLFRLKLSFHCLLRSWIREQKFIKYAFITEYFSFPINCDWKFYWV